MFGLDMLNVVIGLAFVYLVISLICSIISEVLLNIVRSYRADYLEKGLNEIFCGQGGVTLLKQFYNHPLIYSLFRGDYPSKKWRSNLPSYIPAKTFALVLTDLVKVSDLTSWVPVSGTGPDVMGALKVLWDSAGNDIDKFRQNIEEWYNAAMNRVSGWYKKHTSIVGFVICIIVTIIVNIDTIAICQKLSMDGHLRSTVAFASQQILLKHQDLASSTSSDLSGVSEDIAKQLNDAAAKIKEDMDSLKDTSLPLGWQSSDINNFKNNFEMKLAGWLLTAFALMLGGPFWYNLLQNILRMSKKSQGEQSGTCELTS